jgi:hypothetical protein
VSGDTFRAFSDYLFDGTGHNHWDPASCRAGSIIFVKTDMLSEFCSSKLHLFRRPFILITHNSDFSAPFDNRNGNFTFLLQHPLIFHWFGQNPSTFHSRFTAIPIGLANRYWPHGDINTAIRARKCLLANSRVIKLYLNFNSQTNPQRKILAHYLNSTFDVKIARPTSWESYLNDLCQSDFVVSPPGNGLDCHRTWEAIMMGSIVITESSPLDYLFQDLPVISVKSFLGITDKDLIQPKSWNMDKLYGRYWWNKIQEQRRLLICSESIS